MEENLEGNPGHSPLTALFICEIIILGCSLTALELKNYFIHFLVVI